jgi:riboflavin kinase/FMN adenylyltransferase
MKITSNIEELKNIVGTEGVYLTIGNFDGVHLGHRDFLNHIKNESISNNAKFVVITFVPHPSFVLQPKTNFLLNTYDERRELLSQIGVDVLLELNFTRDFSTQSPINFLNEFVFDLKGLRKVFLGHDFHFGANKEGNHSLAKSIASDRNIEIILHTEFKLKNDTVSSSQIREHLRNGDVESATGKLGREFFLSGRVIKGQGRGKQIGFPTANLGYDKDMIIPAKGVYATKTNINGMIYESVTNIGHNPTFNTGYDIHVETHILGFNRDIYGENIMVSFYKKLRDEKKFSSVNELVTQIDLDVNQVKNLYGKI